MFVPRLFGSAQGFPFTVRPVIGLGHCTHLLCVEEYFFCKQLEAVELALLRHRSVVKELADYYIVNPPTAHGATWC